MRLVVSLVPWKAPNAARSLPLPGLRFLLILFASQMGDSGVDSVHYIHVIVAPLAFATTLKMTMPPVTHGAKRSISVCNCRNRRIVTSFYLEVTVVNINNKYLPALT